MIPSFPHDYKKRCRGASMFTSDKRCSIYEQCGCPSRCYYCGSELSKENFTIDHAVPWMRGGSDTIENYRICCLRCNSKKGMRTEEEFKRNIVVKSAPVSVKQHRSYYRRTIRYPRRPRVRKYPSSPPNPIIHKNEMMFFLPPPFTW